MCSMRSPVGEFRWYDWIVILFVSDISAGLIIALLNGFLGVVMALPVLVLAWLSYENFRSTEHDKGPD